MDLREIQRPLKDRYRAEPEAAKLTLRATGSEAPGGALACSIDIGRAIIEAEAHAGVGGPGTALCSGDLLLAALAACTQLTTQMVAASMGLAVEVAVTVEGDLDLRGTLAVHRGAPVGFEAIRCHVQVKGEIAPRDLARLTEAAERYCVVLSTLRQPPPIEVGWAHGPDA